jgi:hypothetical protein
VEQNCKDQKNGHTLMFQRKKKLDCVRSGQSQKTVVWSGHIASKQLTDLYLNPELELDHQLVLAKTHISAKRKGTKRKELVVRGALK